ncbi:helix-turn-helix transcriptional regulator [Paracoccus thiocyanatus]|uniref:DNA-binding protein n=1 Tax=Paracoccus thiocyanatus TaxID=34006 RepID=A0A3D8P9Y1_9RHOB|nr:helix-turn-helix domain-containing protein [Paracoccus thiocyanatus]RDW12870.1 DNA-binding protein [Paracoccus thiocyanatus]
MQNEPDPDWPRFVRTEEAARLLDLSPRTLEKHRCGGTGPVYRKLGGRVVYTIADLRVWIEGAARQSTSEMAKASGEPDRAFTGTARTSR